VLVVDVEKENTRARELTLEVKRLIWSKKLCIIRVAEGIKAMAYNNR
jgi:hypothetical protein